jgi:hypothetical protein
MRNMRIGHDETAIADASYAILRAGIRVGIMERGAVHRCELADRAIVAKLDVRLFRPLEFQVLRYVRDDRSVMDLLNADYTFVNERLARHYGIPNVYGSRFRRVPVTNDARRGLLGQSSILTVTSYPNRTSPVERGKWILTNLLGVPPQPPPPNIPPLPDNTADGRVLSLRERMEKHRSSPVCAGCHRVMDPIGFSLENFDGIGRWRDRDEGQKIDASGTLFNGAAVDGVVALRREIAKRPEVFVGVITEKMLTYALGRGLEYYDMPAVRKIVRDARATNYKFSSIVLGVARSVPFQMKEVAPAGGTKNTASNDDVGRGLSASPRGPDKVRATSESITR